MAMKGLILALVLIFIFLVLGLTAEFVYILWYRRRFRQESTICGNDMERSVSSAFSGSDHYGYGTPSPSKELVLYYLCWKNQPRVEPTPNTTTTVTPAFTVGTPAGFFPGSLLPAGNLLPPAAEDDLDLEKLRGLYASRFLYTIKEEEKEGAEVVDGKRSTVEIVFPKAGEEKGVAPPERKAVEDHEKDAAAAAEVGEETPFSSACASPLYVTPTSSPLHPMAVKDTAGYPTVV